MAGVGGGGGGTSLTRRNSPTGLNPSVYMHGIHIVIHLKYAVPVGCHRAEPGDGGADASGLYQ